MAPEGVNFTVLHLKNSGFHRNLLLFPITICHFMSNAYSCNHINFEKNLLLEYMMYLIEL